MVGLYDGKVKLVLKYLGFLVTEYKLKFSFQSFPKYWQFYGPIDYYSFYNENGCFTLRNAVQRGEWDAFFATQFSEDQYKLEEREIFVAKFFDRNYNTISGWLNALSTVIQNQIESKNSFFSIKLEQNYNPKEKYATNYTYHFRTYNAFTMKFDALKVTFKK